MKLKAHVVNANLSEDVNDDPVAEECMAPMDDTAAQLLSANMNHVSIRDANRKCGGTIHDDDERFRLLNCEK